MGDFDFWQRWLFVLSVVIVLFGLALAIFNQTPIFDMAFNDQIDPVFWPSSDSTQEIGTFQRWIYGVLGATVTGWGIFMAFIIHYPFKHRERWAWNCLGLGLLIWFLVDTGISLYFKVVFNAVFNTVLFIAAFIPLAFCRKEF